MSEFSDEELARLLSRNQNYDISTIMVRCLQRDILNEETFSELEKASEEEQVLSLAVLLNYINEDEKKKLKAKPPVKKEKIVESLKAIIISAEESRQLIHFLNTYIGEDVMPDDIVKS